MTDTGNNDTEETETEEPSRTKDLLHIFAAAPLLTLVDLRHPNTLGFYERFMYYGADLLLLGFIGFWIDFGGHIYRITAIIFWMVVNAALGLAEGLFATLAQILDVFLDVLLSINTGPLWIWVVIAFSLGIPMFIYGYINVEDPIHRNPDRDKDEE